MNRILAIDVGKKSLGLALYTAVADTVTPLHTIKRTKWVDDLAAIIHVIDQYTVGLIVIGYPLEADGREGPKCQSIRAFTRMLQEEDVPEIVYQDERYSSQVAEEALVALDASRKTRRRVNDAIAAQLILQAYLDSQNG